MSLDPVATAQGSDTLEVRAILFHRTFLTQRPIGFAQLFSVLAQESVCFN